MQIAQSSSVDLTLHVKLFTTVSTFDRVKFVSPLVCMLAG